MGAREPASDRVDPDYLKKLRAEALSDDDVLSRPAATAEPMEHIAQFFAFAHLPPHLQDVSRPFALLAGIILGLPRNPERTVALRKLLESKDAAVRARLAK